MDWRCCVCINHKLRTPADTLIDGNAVCAFHADVSKHSANWSDGRFNLAGTIALGTVPG